MGFLINFCGKQASCFSQSDSWREKKTERDNRAFILQEEGRKSLISVSLSSSLDLKPGHWVLS